jgi:predicted enzyme related to lactoylglutathione lyase
MRFSGVMVGTHDSQRLGAFYTSVLGKPAFQMDTWYGWGDGGQLVIGTHSDVSGANAQPQRMMLMLEVDDVAAEYDRIAGLGAGSIAKPYQPDGADGGWIATLEDPDGNYVQLHTPMPGQ